MQASALPVGACKITPGTIMSHQTLPPLPDWVERTRDWHLRITLRQDHLVTSSASDWSFWYVGAHDAYGEELYRHDVETEELRTIFASADRSALVVKRDFESMREPARWTVWPVTRDGRWLDPIIEEVGRASGQQVDPPSR